jgi:dihydrofolate reductase
MHQIIAIEFVTLDGGMQDPDGAERTEVGGWAFRYGPAAVAGDKFRLGGLLDTGALLVGRKTWQHFSTIWPSRSDEFSAKMNRIPKLVASRSLQHVDAWNNSSLIADNLVGEVCRRKQSQDIIALGSVSVVHELMERDLIDEYRLLTFPIVLGSGARFFEGGVAPIDLELVSAERAGPAVLSIYRRTNRAHGGGTDGLRTLDL